MSNSKAFLIWPTSGPKWAKMGMLGTFFLKSGRHPRIPRKNWSRNICKHKVNTISLRRRVLRPTTVGTADPFGRGNGFDFDLATVMCDVSVIPSIITPLEESEVPPPSRAADYAAPATPAFETVVESPGYTVPLW